MLLSLLCLKGDVSISFQVEQGHVCPWNATSHWLYEDDVPTTALDYSRLLLWKHVSQVSSVMLWLPALTSTSLEVDKIMKSFNGNAWGHHRWRRSHAAYFPPAFSGEYSSGSCCREQCLVSHVLEPSMTCQFEMPVFDQLWEKKQHDVICIIRSTLISPLRTTFIKAQNQFRYLSQIQFKKKHLPL